MSGSGISRAICKSATRFREITMPAPHHSLFTGRIPFLPPNQQHQSTETKAVVFTVSCTKHWPVGNLQWIMFVILFLYSCSRYRKVIWYTSLLFHNVDAVLIFSTFWKNVNSGYAVFSTFLNFLLDGWHRIGHCCCYCQKTESSSQSNRHFDLSHMMPSNMVESVKTTCFYPQDQLSVRWAQTLSVLTSIHVNGAKILWLAWWTLTDATKVWLLLRSICVRGYEKYYTLKRKHRSEQYGQYLTEQ